MSTKQNFNDILRSKFIDRDIPVDEQNWKDMRAMINNSRKRKRRIIWLIFSTGVLLCGLGVYEYFMQSADTKKESSITSIVQAKQENKTVVTTNTNPEQSTTTQATRNEETTTKETAANNNAAATINPTQAKVSVKSSANSVQAKSSTNISASSSNRINNVSKHNAVITSAFVTKTQQAKPSSNVSPKTNIETDESMSATKKNVTKTVTISKPDSTVTSEQSSSSATKTNIPIATSSPSESKQAKSDSAILTPIAKTDSAHKKVDSSSNKTLVQKPASLPPIEGKSASKNHLSIDAGAGYSLGWKYSDTVQGRSINPLIGIGYSHSFDSSWTVKIGIQFSANGGMSSVPFVIKHTTYDFGMNSNDSSVTTKWLYYLTFPFQLEHKLGQKNAIGLGGSVSYLITGSGMVEVSNINGNVNTGSTSTYSQYLYVKGFNRWNASAYLLYKRNLFGKLSAYLIPYFGLIDIKSNSFFNKNTFERDSGIKLILSYNIL